MTTNNEGEDDNNDDGRNRHRRRHCHRQCHRHHHHTPVHTHAVANDMTIAKVRAATMTLMTWWTTDGFFFSSAHPRK